MKSIEPFVQTFKESADAGLIIIGESKLMPDVLTRVRFAGLREVTSTGEALDCLEKETSFFLILSVPLKKDLYDVVVQYDERGGIVQIMDSQMNLRKIEFDPRKARMLLIVLKENLELIEKDFNLREYVGMTEQI